MQKTAKCPKCSEKKEIGLKKFVEKVKAIHHSGHKKVKISADCPVIITCGLSDKQKCIALEVCKAITKIYGNRFSLQIPPKIDYLLKESFESYAGLMEKYAMMVTGKPAMSKKFVKNYQDMALKIISCFA